MAMIGLGLIVVGAASFFLIPKVDNTADAFSVVPVEVSYPAPKLALTDLVGDAVSLNDWRDHVVLVNNWAIWCPPCKAEMPELQAYYHNHQDDGFTVIAIESGEPVADVAQFAKVYGLTFPVWPDEHTLALEAFQNWELPNSYIIDRSGMVRLAWVGPISEQMLEKYVTPLLRE